MNVRMDCGVMSSTLNGWKNGFLFQSILGHVEKKERYLHLNPQISSYQSNILFHDQNPPLGHYERIMSQVS